MKVAICARTSRVEARKSSIVEQIKSLRQYAARNGHEIVKKYVDNRWCGKHLQRPGIVRLRNDLKFKEFEALLVKDIRTLGGSRSELQKLMDLLERHRIKVIFTDESDWREKHMRFTWNFRRLVERDNLSLKIKEGMRQAELKKTQADRLKLGEIMRKK